MRAMIFAAGLGTRLKPLTDTLPKALVPLAGKTLLQWQIERLKAAGITDIVDGIIARKCHMVSDFGKAFDPVADKLTQIAMLFCLVSRFKWMLLPLCVMVIKEVTAGILGLLVIRKTGKVDGAVWHGKATTVSLYSMMIIHLVWYNIPGVISGILIGACTALALLSAFMYSRENVRILLGKKNEHE